MVSICPGFIKTKLTGYQGNIDIVQSWKGMVGIVEKLDANDSGLLMDWEGENVPW